MGADRADRLFETETQRYRGTKRVDKPSPCGAMPAHAGHLRR